MKWIQGLSLLGAAVLLAGCATMGGGDTVQVRMTGADEVPPVNTSASGSGAITVSGDRSVSGSFKLQNAAQILAAHIHEGPAGRTGPVIIPLQKVADNEWVVPPGAKLTESQYQSFKAGGLYVNFHSAQYKGGEIRGQLRPGGGGGRPSGY
jgi:hypothetical protein